MGVGWAAGDIRFIISQSLSWTVSGGSKIKYFLFPLPTCPHSKSFSVFNPPPILFDTPNKLFNSCFSLENLSDGSYKVIRLVWDTCYQFEQVFWGIQKFYGSLYGCLALLNLEFCIASPIHIYRKEKFAEFYSKF